MSSRQSKAERKELRAQTHAQAASRVQRSRRWIFALAGLLVLLAAGGVVLWQSSRAPVSGVKTLEIPQPRTDDLELPVQEILAQTRKNVLANQGSAEAWGWYAAVLDAHHFYEEAERCYRRAHELAPRDVRFSYNLALVLELIGAHPDEALALLRKVAEQEPKFPPVHVRIGHCLALKGEHASAAEAYRSALALDPNLVIARRALGQALLEIEDFAGAALELERVAAAVVIDGPTQAALARVYTQRGESEKALQATERARGLKDALSLPDPVRYQVTRLGRSARLATERLAGRVAEGDFAGAAEDLNLILRTRPNDAHVHEQLAEAYQRLGHA